MAGLDDDDYRLSMRISPRARDDENNDGLRGLLVLRLADTVKAVWRRSLRKDVGSLYCEPCGRWTAPNSEPQEVVTCPTCGRLYRIETVIYKEVDPA